MKLRALLQQINLSKSFFLLFLLATFPIAAQGEEFRVSRFETEGLTGWKAKSFKGYTQYATVTDNGRTVIEAKSRNAASGLFRQVRLDPRTFRYLRWSWKITGTIAGGDEKSKTGDDYAARVYVIFPGRFFWQTKSISYIWANRLPKGESIPNAFTANVVMVAVESGTGRAGQWIAEERDVLADYRSAFHEDPREIGAVAIMTDTDNTGGEAVAWYGDLTLSTGRTNSAPLP